MSDTWFELDDYITRSIEYIRTTMQYTETELLAKHEIDFFRILKRADELQKEKAQRLEERRQKSQRK